MAEQILERSPKNLYANFQLEKPNFRGTFTSENVWMGVLTCFLWFENPTETWRFVIFISVRKFWKTEKSEISTRADCYLMATLSMHKNFTVFYNKIQGTDAGTFIGKEIIIFFGKTVLFWKIR